MKFWLPSGKWEDAVSALPPPPPATIRLAAKFCDPFTCSATRTGVDLKAIGGATHSQGVPEVLQRRRWKRSLTVPVRNKFSVTASAWEDASGEGSVTWDLLPRRPRKRMVLSLMPGNGVLLSSDSLYRANDDELLKLRDNPHYDSSLTICASSIAAPQSRRGRVLKARTKRAKPTQRFRVELKRELKYETVAFQREDVKYGKINFALTPSRRVAASIAVKEAFWKSFWQAKNNRKKKGLQRRQLQVGKEKGAPTVNMAIQSDFEYRWKENCFSILGAIQAFNGTLSLRSRTNPLRFTPRIQVPLGASKDAPWMNWVHEPGSGWGEVQLGHKGMEMSVDFPKPRLGWKQKNADGSLMRLVVGKDRVFVVDKTIITKPLLGGTFVTLNAHLTNVKAETSLNAALTGPFGVVSAAASSRSVNVLVDFNVDKGQRAYSIALKVEENKTIAARVGLYF